MQRKCPQGHDFGQVLILLPAVWSTRILTILDRKYLYKVEVYKQRIQAAYAMQPRGHSQILSIYLPMLDPFSQLTPYRSPRASDYGY
ncbi:uncharacterized protein F4812DRAFT_439924 [Daldinia caldariorum]|uniref:uncharacterized protein n=1 Tax=Daldinia caldariorum TaxID=326644 RepID=UPI0020085E99|nr:uncharacterized protein F4812DRAFT_439924 [Daldinia caldariorum]KAI1465173.1 hypothetical protein F4812DRAFT_439924 [Daldinia caldariorum]